MDDVCTGVRIGGSLRLVPGDGVERALGDDGDVAAATQQRRDRFRAGELVRFRRCVLSGEAGERGNDLRERWVSCGGGEDGVADPFALDFPACDELPGWEEFVDGALAGGVHVGVDAAVPVEDLVPGDVGRSEEHTSELQSRPHLVCRLLLEKKKKTQRSASVNTSLSTLVNHLSPPRATVT